MNDGGSSEVRCVAVAAERGCSGVREVRCVAVAAAVRMKKMVLRRLLDGSCSRTVVERRR